MIKKLHEQLKNGEITSVKLTEKYLDNLKKKEKDVDAFLTVREEEALSEAQKVDEKIKKGVEIDMLAGIPSAVKDNMCIQGCRTTAGSKILDNYIAPFDATVISKLNERDAVILGKTNLDEFAMGASGENSGYKKTKHPLDPTRVPGGSSAGSAASVAAGQVAWALGSDTGGSIRQPASFCGLVGMKPTYGRVSRHGLIAMGSSLDQIGPLTTSVEDAAIILSSIAGHDLMDATSAKSADKKYEDFIDRGVKGVKIGIPKEYMGEGIDEKVKEQVQKAIDKFKKLGAEIVEISLPHTEYALPVYYIIMPCEVSSNLARFDGIKYGLRVDDKKDTPGAGGSLWEVYFDSRKYGLGDEVKRRVMLGTYALSAGYYDAYYLKAQKVRRLIRNDFEEAFKKVNLIFTPTTPEVAFKFGEKANDPLKMYLSDIFTVTANLAGVPAISIPIGKVKEGDVHLPVGGQIMGNWFDEEGVLNAANAFELEMK